ncbi:hypothetical protein LSH36_40g19044 [Paralvinella palmiformis]|uniref:MCM AAA-lid domain-containing protein n=1 Tax=Paralvinella palmiformis TaxID=53620 RepID=A0AAD9NF67_9ANNE|nr:hypothetical protein LSH36_40g19044 [Paralvinella palmiformis]
MYYIINKFLQLARQIKPEFSEAGENLIKGYYVASRTLRVNDIQLWTPPIGAVKVVTALSEAHAKLCLRDVVTEHDAVMAILLYEEYVTIRSGNKSMVIGNSH